MSHTVLSGERSELKIGDFTSMKFLLANSSYLALNYELFGKIYIVIRSKGNIIFEGLLEDFCQYNNLLYQHLNPHHQEQFMNILLYGAGSIGTVGEICFVSFWSKGINSIQDVVIDVRNDSPHILYVHSFYNENVPFDNRFIFCETPESTVRLDSATNVILLCKTDSSKKQLTNDLVISMADDVSSVIESGVMSHSLLYRVNHWFTDKYFLGTYCFLLNKKGYLSFNLNTTAISADLSNYLLFYKK